MATPAPYVPMMTATFNGMTGIPPPNVPLHNLPQHQVVPYQPQQQQQMILYQPPNPNPTHTQTITWKGKARQAEAEFRKTRNKVRNIAPELFKDNGEENDPEANIFPKTAREYAHFKYDMYDMRAAELEENANKLRQLIEAKENLPKGQPKIKSAFGADGKVFNNFFGPVLSKPTIWSDAYDAPDQQYQAPWPTQAELLWNGDNRENNRVGTRCGRFLPPPRAAGWPGQSFLEKEIQPQYPMDRAGPHFEEGPHFMEATHANWDMDADMEFEEEGVQKLFGGAEKEIGIPNWKIPLTAPPASQGMADLVREFEGLETS